VYFKLKRGIIIHDRWLSDLSVTFDYKHYENRLVKKLFTIFLRPDIFILLTVPDEIAYLRKRDDAGHVQHDVQYYRVIASRVLENARRWHCNGIIDANRAVEEVADDVLAVITKLSTRGHRKEVVC
jgi:thymidylate kinase